LPLAEPQALTPSTISIVLSVPNASSWAFSADQQCLGRATVPRPSPLEPLRPPQIPSRFISDAISTGADRDKHFPGMPS